MSGRLQLVVFNQRFANRQATRLEERVCHRAADHQLVDFLQKVLDHLDLVGHLRAADNGDERAIRRFQRMAKIADRKSVV